MDKGKLCFTRTQCDNVRGVFVMFRFIEVYISGTTFAAAFVIIDKKVWKVDDEDDNYSLWRVKYVCICQRERQREREVQKWSKDMTNCIREFNMPLQLSWSWPWGDWSCAWRSILWFPIPRRWWGIPTSSVATSTTNASTFPALSVGCGEASETRNLWDQLATNGWAPKSNWYQIHMVLINKSITHYLYPGPGSIAASDLM